MIKILYLFVVSSLLGHLVLFCLFSGKNLLEPMVHFFLAVGLGLGITAIVLFWSIVLLGSLHHLVVFFVLTGGCLVLLWWAKRIQGRQGLKDIFPRWPLNRGKGWFLFGFLLFILFFLYQAARSYPLGGWDAYAVWNYKAKMIFLGGESWTNMLNPALWRSSPHYPLLLPLINAWGWICVGDADYRVPLFTAVLFAFMTAGLLSFSLKQYRQRRTTLWSGIFLLTSPLFLNISLNQYADIVFSYYLLAGISCVVFTLKTPCRPLGFLSGLFLGLLSFTKTEGFAASVILLGLGTASLLAPQRGDKNLRFLLWPFLAGFFISFSPSLFFKLFYAPGNATFVNGFFSSDKPWILERFQTTLRGYGYVLAYTKWRPLWLLIGVGFLLNLKKIFTAEFFLAPTFLLIYFFVLTAYYQINTYFDIVWWLKTTLPRIFGALIPIFLFVVFCLVWKPVSTERGGD